MIHDTLLAFASLLINTFLTQVFTIAMAVVYGGELLFLLGKKLVTGKFQELKFWIKAAPTKYPHDYSVFVTGAGTGLGRGFCIEYTRKFIKMIQEDKGESKDFDFKIFAVSRTAKTLEQTKAKCEKLMKEAEISNEKEAKNPALNLFSKISVQIIPETDVADQENFRAVYEKCCNGTKTKSIDLVIANAGVAPLCSKSEFQEENTNSEKMHEEKLLSSFQKWEKITLKTKETNIDGVMYTIFTAVEQFFKAKVEMKKNEGKIEVRPPQIAVVSSLNAYTPNWAGIYGMSKKAVLDYAYFLRNEVKHLGIKINVIVPGYLKTEFQRSILSEKHGTGKAALDKIKKDMSGMMKPKEAANCIIPQLERDEQIIQFNFVFWAIMQFMSTVPFHFDRWFFAPLIKMSAKELEENVYWTQDNESKKVESKKQK